MTMQRGLRLLLALDAARPRLAALADSLTKDCLAGTPTEQMDEALRELWLFARGTTSVESVMLYLKVLIARSRPHRQWRAGQLGQRVLSQLAAEVREVSEEMARSAQVLWEPSLWSQAALIYLSSLASSYKAQTSLASKAPEQKASSDDGANSAAD